MDMMYILLLIVLASLGTGYAYIKSNLNITGTANVTAANWSVHFDNLNVTDGSVTAETEANITDDITVEFAATLEELGDFYEFTVDVENEGTMDAMIDSFSISPELTTVQAKYLEYTVTYSDGVELEDKQELKAEATETIKVRFSYIENEDKTNYPTEDQSFNIEFTVNCAQADEESVEIRKELYSISDSSGGITVGDTISSLNNTYKTYEDLVNSTGYNIFLKHKIINEEIIGDTQIGFLNNNQVYYLTGGDYGQSFEDNKTLLKNAFGEENCTLTEPSDEPIPLPGTYEYGVYYCTNANLEVRVTSYGGIIASENDSNYTCYFSAYVNNSFSCPLGTFYLPHPKPY